MKLYRFEPVTLQLYERAALFAGAAFDTLTSGFSVRFEFDSSPVHNGQGNHQEQE